MLINLSNHPRAKWQADQIRAAEQSYGSVVDLAFPAIDPHASNDEVRAVTGEAVVRCEQLLAQTADVSSVVHVMGEFTFTFLFVKAMEARGIPCVCSTTERIVVENPDGTKTQQFNFVSFRHYY